MGKKVITSKSSSKLFGNNTEDVVQKAKARAMLTYLKAPENSTTYVKEYLRDIYLAKGRVKGYYRYGLNHLIYGLPTFTIYGYQYDFAAIKTAIDTDLGIDSVVDTAYENFLTIDEWFGHELQKAPYLYLPYFGTLTHTDAIALIEYTDWRIVDIVYQEIADNYDVNVRREHKDISFWIEGPVTVTEGSNLDLIIRTNTYIPANTSVTINLSYSGTLPGTEYTPVASVVMTALKRNVVVSIPILEDAVVDADATLIVTIDSIVDTDSTFNTAIPSVTAGFNDSHTATVKDNEGVILTLNDAYTNEWETEITVPVTLGDAAAGAFTVDYSFTDGTAVGSPDALNDYNNTGGTLNFTGAAGETVNIVVPLNADVPDNTKIDFTVNLSNSSDPAVDVTRTAIVTIVSNLPDEPAYTFTEELSTFTQPVFDDKNYLLVQYHEATDPVDFWRFWLYDSAVAPFYTGLDATTVQGSIDDMMPVTIMRKQKVSLDDTHPYWPTAQYSLNFLSMNMNTFMDDVNSNPDIADVDDLFLNFAVSPADTGVPLVSRLLYDHFYKVVVDIAIPANSDNFRTYWVEDDSNNETTWKEQTYTQGIVGVKAAVGEHFHEVTETKAYKLRTTKEDTFYVLDRASFTYDLHIYHQVTETTYDYILITELQSKSQVTYNGRTRYLINKANESDMTIPMSFSLLDPLEAEEMAIVYQYLCRIDSYAIVIQNVKWYESSLFLDLLEFAAIVITFVSFGSATSVFAFLKALVVNRLILELVIYVAEETGNTELAVLVGIAASMALGGQGAPQFDFGTADQLLTTVQNFSDLAFAAEQGIVNVKEEELEDIQQDIDRLEELVEPDRVDSDFYTNLILSPDTLFYTAGPIQFDFDSQLTGAYDRLIHNFHDQLLKPGIT